MITKRFFLSGIVSASAIASASQFLPVEWPKPYATVYGVGWDLEVVEHDVWTQQDALNFANFGRGGIDQFREITEIVYHVPMKPLPEKGPSWRQDTLSDQLKRFGRPVTVLDTGFTNIAGFKAIWDWQNSLRPDVARTYGDWDCEWAKEQALAEQDYEANAAKYIAEVLGEGTGNA
jgi:hypothetical protein